ncbi:hypothetical protein KSF_079080 [Reticulibacter mediterranei]|uniref:Uncharacterized protein n=1 Tax=Reticulibacter mediterranei TaxID=2778369 RepID=A0A8J3IW29_9CHLR|nr:hypothetical protein [Reticulibacter mediterranei]GHO97860.1 hypothetical protein KSF_079080 [Reticulibacter mediterranei]
MNKWFSSRMTRLSKREYRAALGVALLAITLVFGAFSFAPSAYAASLTPASSSGVQQARQASYPKKGWALGGDVNISIHSSGSIIFYNRSVQIGGNVAGVGPKALGGKECAAVVFIVYSGSKRLSSAARPGTGVYTCGKSTFGFTLPANVSGGATKVLVQLWAKSCQCLAVQQYVKR